MTILPYDFEESPGAWVCATARAFRKAMDEELAPLGITFPQWQVLACLAQDGELSQSELAHRLEVEPPTLVGVLARMERAGWIGRRNCPTDRRKRLYRPRPRVAPVWRRLVECARRVRARATRGLAPRQLRQVKGALASMRAHVGAPARAKEIA